MTQPAPLLTPAEVVEHLARMGISIVEETVRQWARSGRIRHVRLPGGHYLFRPEDVDAIAVPIEPDRLDSTEQVSAA